MNTSNLEIADLRKNYTLQSLDQADVQPNPIAQFQHWFKEALSATLPEPNAMVLATVDASGQPSARVVLLKGLDARGFIFYTNYESRKGQQLAANPKASLCFNWLELERQVRIEGIAEQVPAEESDAYFQSRPFESRIGALASQQSTPVHSREELEQTYTRLLKQFENKPVVRPENWGGYVLRPKRVEFWQGRPGRLHDRIEYERDSKNNWSIRRLSP